MAAKSAKTAQYSSIIVRVFQNHWKKGVEEFEFHRDELVAAAVAVGVERPDNLGDVIYSFKFRREMPPVILAAAPKGTSWMLEGAGHGRYRFRLLKIGSSVIKPRADIAPSRFPTRLLRLSGPMLLATSRLFLPRFAITG